LLGSHFAKIATIPSEGLVIMDQVGLLVDRWNQSHSEIVSVADGLDDIKQLESLDLFEQFLLNPQEFAAFLRKCWSRTYSALFVFQIQPLLSDLPCCVIHVWQHCNEKKDANIVQHLQDLQNELRVSGTWACF
jgi:hypothetical protein